MKLVCLVSIGVFLASAALADSRPADAWGNCPAGYTTVEGESYPDGSRNVTCENNAPAPLVPDTRAPGIAGCPAGYQTVILVGAGADGADLIECRGSRLVAPATAPVVADAWGHCPTGYTTVEGESYPDGSRNISCVKK